MMSDVVWGAVGFGVFAVLTLYVAWSGRDTGPDPDEIEIGSGRPPQAVGEAEPPERVPSCEVFTTVHVRAAAA